MRNQFEIHATLVADEFIDTYMASANGEYVKVYLYILRHQNEKVDLPSIADALNHTEADVRRALAYWEKMGVLGDLGGQRRPGPQGGRLRRPHRFPASENTPPSGASFSWQGEAPDRQEQDPAWQEEPAWQKKASARREEVSPRQEEASVRREEVFPSSGGGFRPTGEDGFPSGKGFRPDRKAEELWQGRAGPSSGRRRVQPAALCGRTVYGKTAEASGRRYAGLPLRQSPHVLRCDRVRD